MHRAARCLGALCAALALSDCVAFGPVPSALRVRAASLRQAAVPRLCAGTLPPAPPPKDGDFVDIFCRGTNSLMKQLVVRSRSCTRL